LKFGGSELGAKFPVKAGSCGAAVVAGGRVLAGRVAAGGRALPNEYGNVENGLNGGRARLSNGIASGAMLPNCEPNEPKLNG